jgi:hypothetical protein
MNRLIYKTEACHRREMLDKEVSVLVQRDVVTPRENGHGHVSPLTAEYFDGEIDSDGLRRLLTQAAGAPGLQTPGRVCVLYGYGSRPASLYRELQVP